MAFALANDSRAHLITPLRTQTLIVWPLANPVLGTTKIPNAREIKVQ